MSLKSVDTCFLVSSRTRSKRAHNRYEASVHFGPVPFRGRLSDRNSVRTELRGWHNIGAMLPTQLGRSTNAFRSTPRFLVRPFRQEHADPRVHTIVCLGAGPRNPEPGSRAAPPRGLGPILLRRRHDSEISNPPGGSGPARNATPPCFCRILELHHVVPFADGG